MPPTLPRLPYISPRPTAQIDSPPRRGGVARQLIRSWRAGVARSASPTGRSLNRRPAKRFGRSDHPVCAFGASSPLKELGVTHWPARVSNPFAEREFVACADGVFGYELQALQKQFHHKAAEF